MTEKQALKGLGRHVKWYNNHCSEWTMLASLERTGSIVVSTQSWRGAVRGRASSTCGTRRSTTRPPLNWSPIPRVDPPCCCLSGYALGAGTALLGKEATIACTVAVEVRWCGTWWSRAHSPRASLPSEWMIRMHPILAIIYQNVFGTH